MNLIERFAEFTGKISEATISEYYKYDDNFIKRAIDGRMQKTPERSRMAIDLIKQYLAAYLLPTKLYEIREASLKRQLESWGLIIGNQDSYKLLRKTSSSNIMQIRSRLKMTPYMALPDEIKGLVNKMQLVFRHNSELEKIHGAIMISSARLRQLGLRKTLQAQGDFNRNFVKSDDQLYFYVEPTFAGSQIRDSVGREHLSIEESTASRYGNHRFYLKSSVAEDYGWISPYLMEKGDLASYRKSLKNIGVDVESLTEAETLQLFRRNLFTVNDFLFLYREILGNYLAGNIKQSGYMKSPEGIRRNLEKGMYYSLNDAQIDLREFSIELGISGGLMELKVPAAILASDIEVE